MTDIVRFRDFSLSLDPVTFKIHPDTFECHPEIPLDVLMELSLANTGDQPREKQIERMHDLLDGILTIQSSATFWSRTRRPTENKPNPHPIGMRHIRELLPWLMEVYGLRPTQQSSESPDGSSDEDTSSTDGV